MERGAPLVFEQTDTQSPQHRGMTRHMQQPSSANPFQLAPTDQDPSTSLLKAGAPKVLQAAIDEEVSECLALHALGLWDVWLRSSDLARGAFCGAGFSPVQGTRLGVPF